MKLRELIDKESGFVVNVSGVYSDDDFCEPVETLSEFPEEFLEDNVRLIDFGEYAFVFSESGNNVDPDLVLVREYQDDAYSFGWKVLGEYKYR